MARRCGILIQDFGVYDKEDVLMFVGNSLEVAEFAGLKSRAVVHSTVSRQAKGTRGRTRKGYIIVALGS